MRIFTEKEINKAFKEEDYINNLLKKLVKDNIPNEDTFWSGNNSEFIESEATLIEDRIWNMTVQVNGGSQPTNAYQMWRDYPNYNCGGQAVASSDREAEIKEKSETEKVLNDCGDYRISLIRDELRAPTRTCWGWKFMLTEYAVIDNETNEVVFKTHKKWLFRKTLKAKLKTQATETLYSKLGKGLFKMKIIPLNDTAMINKVFNSLGNPMQDLENIIESYDNLDNKHIVVIYGNGANGRYVDSDLTTFYIYDDILTPNPTYDNALKGIIKLYKMYDYNDFYEVLNHRKMIGTDLNTLDLALEDRIHYLVNKKVLPTFERVLKLNKKVIFDIFA